MTAKGQNSLMLDTAPRWTLNLLLLGFIVYCSSFFAQLTWRLVPVDVPEFTGGASWTPAKEVTSQTLSGDASVLLTLSLFGKEGITAGQKTEKRSVNAPKTSLQLQLKGVFTAERERESSAIVAERGKPGEYYRVGDKLPGNAELVSVYSDRVLLKRNGRLETLGFEDKADGGNVIDPVKSVSNNRSISSPRQFVDVAEKRLAENPATALASVGLKPVEQGAASGYVYDGKNPMLSGMNLKPGDVVRSVNGYPLGDINKDRTLLKQLYEQGSLEVEVERDGTSFYINYPLR